jgi:adenine-specific DNA-methyltransferase
MMRQERLFLEEVIQEVSLSGMRECEVTKPTRKPRVLRYKKSDPVQRPIELVRDLEQLYLLEAPVTRQKPDTEEVVSRYHQNGSRAKVLGAVYTPPRVATALARWAIRSPSDRALDPSCGEGVFLSAARTRLVEIGARRPRYTGVDIDPQTAAAAGAICSDFFEWVRSAPKYDVVLGNPPFIRSHLFSERSRMLAFAGMVQMRLRPSRLMSTWAPFLALSCSALSENGRLGMVIPEELLHVGYARELRRFLLNRFKRVIVCFPPNGIFPEVQQAVILLLCDNHGDGQAGLFTMEYSDLEERNFEALRSAGAWAWNHKWTHLFLDLRQRDIVDQCWQQLDWQPFRSYGRVEVGVVTGDNGFFIVNQERASQFDKKHLVPIVTSARDLQGIKFTADDFRRVLSQNRPAFLLKVQEPPDKLPAGLRSYLQSGELEHVNSRFKCRNREPWYAVPSVWESDALLLRQAGEMPRLVHLSKRCTATDTIHRVWWNSPSHAKRQTGGFMNSWTLLMAELTGRSYGGGVLELMPSEANQLPMPGPVDALDRVFDQVDEQVRSHNLYDAVAIVDKVVMPEWMNKKRREEIETVLAKLIQRRKLRNHVHHR